MVVHTYKPSTQKVKMGDQQFKASLGYIAGPWPKKGGREGEGQGEERRRKEKGGDREGLLLGAKF